MTSPTETFAAANKDLDDMGNALVEGANMAPRLTMDTIITMRSVLERHRPRETRFRAPYCYFDGRDWPCPDATDVLKVLGLPEDDDAEQDY